MENILCEDYSAKKHLTNVKYQLLNDDFQHIKKNMTSIVPSPTGSKDYKQAYINHPNENPSQNDNTCHESDEYDSDCSLGSLNSLYLRLKNNSKVIDLNTTDRVDKKQLQSTICKLSNTESFPGNNDDKETNISKHNIMVYDKTENTKPIKKLNTRLFYGKQKSTSQHIFTRLPHEYSLKKKFSNSKRHKTKNAVCKFKYNTKKLKKPKQRRHLTIQKTLSTSELFWGNKYSIRSQLKKPVPLLQFSAKFIKKDVDSLKNTTENLLPNKIEFIKDEHIIKKEDISSLESSFVENELYESNNFFIDDFMDTDDFGGTKEIENIIQTLFDNDDSLIDNETNKWWTIDHDYEDHDEIQDKFFLLFTEFNNF